MFNIHHSFDVRSDTRFSQLTFFAPLVGSYSRRRFFDKPLSSLLYRYPTSKRLPHLPTLARSHSSSSQPRPQYSLEMQTAVPAVPHYRKHTRSLSQDLTSSLRAAKTPDPRIIDRRLLPTRLVPTSACYSTLLIRARRGMPIAC